MLREMMKLARAFLSEKTNMKLAQNLEFSKLLPYIIKDPYQNLDTLEQIKKPRLFLIQLKTDNKKLFYSELEMLEYSQEHGPKIVLLDSSGGQYSSPTFKILPRGGKNLSIDERIKNGIYHAIDTLLDYFKINFKDKKSIGYEIQICLQDNLEQIKEDLLKKQRSIFSKQPSLSFNSILSLQLDRKFVIDLPFITNIIENRMLTTSFKFPETPNSSQRICSICHKENVWISGFVSPFSFYTVDKLGYIPGGFTKPQAINNFPVCKNCALLLEVGKRVLQKNFSTMIGKEKCFIIPKNLKDPSNLQEFLLLYDEGIKKLSSKSDFKKNRDNETNYLELLGENDDFLRFDFIFYEETGPGNSQFNILLYIKDISPSRIRNIANAIDKVNEFDPNHPFFGLDTRNYPMLFRFNDLRNLYLREDNNKFDREAFLKIIYCLFIGQKIKFHNLIKRFFKGLNNQLYDDKKSKLKSVNARLGNQVKKFLPILNLFNQLNLLTF